MGNTSVYYWHICKGTQLFTISTYLKEHNRLLLTIVAVFVKQNKVKLLIIYYLIVSTYPKEQISEGTYIRKICSLFIVNRIQHLFVVSIYLKEYNRSRAQVPSLDHLNN